MDKDPELTFPPFPAQTSTLQDLLTEAQSWRLCLDKTPINFYTHSSRLRRDSLKWAVKFETVVDLGLWLKTFLQRVPGQRSTEAIIGLGGVGLMGITMHCQLPSLLKRWCTRPPSRYHRAQACSCICSSGLRSADQWFPTGWAQWKQQLGTWAAWQRPAKPVMHNAFDFNASDFLSVQPPERSWGWSKPGLVVVLVLHKETSLLGMSTSTSCTWSTEVLGPKGCNMRGPLSTVRAHYTCHDLGH